ncbi:hypothetical protein BRE01_18190 [Brevibacillus reuszeri]|uniref:Uncharacterized protein n=1 Tax=Brevibacillus reuszeri TaxID=54915 RepID=A0ABQ0TJU8_9BACL|nr:hypothetical protein BRE01_18190 [Brevibacillus reuszeri]
MTKSSHESIQSAVLVERVANRRTIESYELDNSKTPDLRWFRRSTSSRQLAHKRVESPILCVATA